ncbi:DUF2142 domain-containing protein [Cryobacterium lyxosi]|uniref:DUF2142 domain-containing protein n=1 Tax=Cryobacterium lyxosi TaxID=1259228 RepID=A0A4R8ZIX4_9MICO|nr:DUF2142 domain-containing protein [Cryobacterium lyxosi]TFD29214.1 DUF2142 domain-containing protein [Cryobacterium lyxosi]
MRRFLDALAAGRWVTLFVSGLFIFLVSAAWAISTPLGASPDEPAHIIKAASVARGQLIGEITEAPAVTRVQVPSGLAAANEWPCFAFDSTKEASCTPKVSNESDLVSARTSAGLYNPTYYAIVGVPSLLTDDTSRAVMLMRLAGALVGSFFLAVTFCALLRLGNPVWTGLGFLAALTPMFFFLNGAVNPNALEIATGAALLAALLVVVGGKSTQDRWWLGVVAASGLLLAQARGLSPLWMAMIALAVLTLTPWSRLSGLLKRLDVWLTVAILGAGVGAAGMWIVATGTLSNMGVFPGAGEVGRGEAFVEMLVGRSFDPGIVGVFGWLDTMAPALAYVLWSFLGLGLVVGALTVARGRSLAAVVVCVAGLMLVPPIVQAASVKSSGYIWQGRYALVAYVVVVLIAGVAMATARVPAALPGERFPIRFIGIVGGLVVVGQLFSMATAIRRYSVGADTSWLDSLRQAPLWVPPGGSAAWLVITVLGMSGIVGLWAVAVRASTVGVPKSHEAPEA